MKYSAFILALFFVLSGCRTEETVSETASHSSESGKATFPADSSSGSGNGKLTPPNEADKQLRMGLKLRLKAVAGPEAQKLAKEFEDQLRVFEPCKDETGKGEVVRVVADFDLKTDGTVTAAKVVETVPTSPEFEKCFLKQIQQLDMGPQVKIIRGQLTVGTFYGAQADWATPVKAK